MYYNQYKLAAYYLGISGGWIKMDRESNPKSTSERFATIFEYIGRALYEMADGVSKGPSELKLIGLCVLSIVSIICVVSLAHSPALGLYIIAGFAITTVLIIMIIGLRHMNIPYVNSSALGRCNFTCQVAFDTSTSWTETPFSYSFVMFLDVQERSTT